MANAKLTLLLLFLVSILRLQGQSFEDILWTADWSKDGRYIAFGGNHGVLYIYSGEDYQLMDTLVIPQTITNVQWHPTSEKLAIVTQFETSKAGILELTTKKMTPFTDLSPVGARGLSWHPDGDLIAVGDNDGHLLIYDDQIQLVDSFTIDPKSVIALDWHPHDRIVTCVGSIHGIYNVTDKSLNIYEPRIESVLNLSIAWHPTGAFYVTGDYGDYDNDYKALLQWRDKSGQLLKTIQASEAEYRNIRWSPSGEFLATASELLRIWSKDGILIKEIGSPHLLWGLSWHPDGSKLITTSISGEARIVDINGNTLHIFDLPH